MAATVAKVHVGIAISVYGMTWLATPSHGGRTCRTASSNSVDTIALVEAGPLLAHTIGEAYCTRTIGDTFIKLA